jgi:NAD(P)-dependent dehydrogenase (short-subunit alcohol dehydrogenase family)
MTALEAAGIECFEMDVTSPDALKAVKDQVADKTGGTLDILVNNAGHGIFLQNRHFCGLITRVFHAHIGYRFE